MLKHLFSRIFAYKRIGSSIRLFAIALVAVALTALPSLAHWADLAVGELQINPQDAVLNLTIPTGLVGSADDNHDQQLTAGEIDRHRVELTQLLGDRIQLSNQRGELGTWAIKVAPRALVMPQANTSSHTSLQLDYRWNQPIEELTLRYRLFDPAATAARCLITAMHNGKTQSLVFTPTAPEFTLISRSIGKQIYSFALLGIEHILTGYDHILFLISLLLVSDRFSAIVKIVTAFTVSHSVTLSLAVLNIVSLPSQWVECAIALTIVYVAGENLWKKDFNHRWALTFGFGLVHGLGFAGVLREIQIPHSNLLTSLASFNLGVELGQIMVVTACFFLLRFVRRQFEKSQRQLNFNRIASIGIITIGLVWFVQRAIAIA
jgi:hydrogenase/urease accessory protein HupE